jgi:transcriptional regulator with XRE-family HTH domain
MCSAILDGAWGALYVNIMTSKVNKKRRAASAENAVAAAVSGRIAALRKSQGLTFDALARRAGVAKGTLVQIEQECANPSIATLCRIAAALGVSVADLVAPVYDALSKTAVVKSADARRLWSGPQGGSAVLLAGTRGPDMLEMWNWELKPGERYEASRHGRGTRELIHVTSGKLLLEIEGQGALVASGATAIAHTDCHHAYANPGKSPVRFVMTVHEPVSAP